MRKITSTIVFKLIVPIVIIFIIVMSIAFTRIKLMNEEKFQQNGLDKAKELTLLMKNKISSISNATMLTSSMYANFSSVKWAYSVYKQAGNLDSARSIIKRNVMPIINGVSKDVGFEQKIHFHIPPATSLFRSWTDKNGDDLSSFRQSILYVSKTHEPVKTIEIGRGGYQIRGIAPVFDKKNNYVGSVETFFPFTLVFDRIFSDNNKQSYAIYISEEKSQLIDNLSISTINTINNFSIFNASKNYDSSLLKDKDFVFTDIEKDKYKIEGNCACVISPIIDFSKNIIGVVVMQVDLSDDVAYVKHQLIRNIIQAFIVISLIILIAYLGINWIVIKPIDKLSIDIEELAKGKLNTTTNNNTGVIEKIYNSFSIMLERLKTTTNFANEIGKGNLNVSLDNVNKEDELSNSLLKMKENLLKAQKEQEKNKQEEEKRAWATKGFAEFGEILRSNNTDIEAFSTEIITNLVKYTNSNQGGLFLLNDNDKDDIILELQAVYAYNRKKYAEKQIKLGEGLVGTCAIEKQSIFMTDVPDNYINITSGLGDANPNCILIVPLKIEEEVFGVIELASFNIYEDYQIKFIEKLAESIASTLSAAKTNLLTQELLEQSQQQTEELAATEEEMRQNLEEMQATQEQLHDTNTEIKRKNNEMQAQMKAIDKVALVSKTNPKGIITYVNDIFCEVAGYTREELIGKPHNIVRHPDMTKAAFRNLWETIQAGNVWSGKVKNKTKDGGFYWVDANISPIYDENGNLKEYIAIRYLVTHYINDEQTVKLVHSLFPDKDEETNYSNQNNDTLKLSEKNKEEKNIEDAKLIKELKKEHSQIANIFIELQQIGVASKKGMDLLLKSKELLLSHLEKEDEELYPVLKEEAKNDDSIKTMLTSLGEEMEQITKALLNFYNKYTNFSEINKTEFIRDISNILVAFKDRVAKEEMMLYDEYNKLHK